MRIVCCGVRKRERETTRKRYIQDKIHNKNKKKIQEDNLTCRNDGKFNPYLY